MEPGHGGTHRQFSSVLLLLTCNLLCSRRTYLTILTHQVRCQSPSERQQVLDHLESQLADFLSDSKESSLFTQPERRDLEKEVQQAQQYCQDLLHNMETGKTLRLYLNFTHNLLRQ